MAQTKSKGKKGHISTVLRILVAVGALYLAFGGDKKEFGELVSTMRSLSPWAFAGALGLYLFAQLLFVMRWRLLLRVLSVHIGLGIGLKLHFLGWFYNNCLPSSVGGDLLRAWYVTRHVESDKRTDAALSVFFDRIVGLTGMFLMAAGCYLFIPVEKQIDGQTAEISSKTSIFGQILSHWQLIIWIIAAVVAVFAIIVATKRGRSILAKVLIKFLHIAEKVIAAMKLYIKSPLAIALAIFLTIFLQGISIIGFWLLGRNMGLDSYVHIKYYFVFFPVSWLIGTIPISIGGLGVMEGAISSMFESVGAPKALGLAIAACQRLIWWCCAVPGIAIHLFGAHLPANKREFFVDSEGNGD